MRVPPRQRLPPQGGQRPPTNDERRKELGISKKQDERWQELALVPQEQFEEATIDEALAHSVLAGAITLSAAYETAKASATARSVCHVSLSPWRR